MNIAAAIMAQGNTITESITTITTTMDIGIAAVTTDINEDSGWILRLLV